jgi:polysaccharide pyruvyl transferase WcaK-like protein
MNLDPVRRRIALFGNFGVGNLGNEATLQAMVYNLRRYLPNVEISCICSGPENTASEYNIAAAPIRPPFPIWKISGESDKKDAPAGRSNGSDSGVGTMELHLWFKVLARLRAPMRLCTYPLRETYRWFRAIAKLRKSDLLVMTGTGMLGGPDRALHYEIFRWAVIAKLCRCRLLFVSVGGGPIHHPLSRRFAKAALALADYRSYRDAPSKDYVGAIGVDVKNDAVYPDLAFSLPRAVETVDQDLGQPGVVIGVGVMNYHDRSIASWNDETMYHEYLGRVASLVVRLLERGNTVRIFIGDVMYDQDVRQDLRRALDERGVKYEDGRIIDQPPSSVDELLSQLSSVDVVVASRFHNLLLALMLRKPVFAISYHEKFQPLMDGVGLGEFCQDIEHINVDELVEKIVRLHEDGADIKLNITQEIERYRIALDEQYERILELSRPVSKSHRIIGKGFLGSRL